jgi:hypothetical protein
MVGRIQDIEIKKGLTQSEEAPRLLHFAPLGCILRERQIKGGDDA